VLCSRGILGGTLFSPLLIAVILIDRDSLAAIIFGDEITRLTFFSQ
jgi:hypothetical protein